MSPLPKTINKDTSREAIAAAFDDITDGLDGPVTPFVMLSRAVELARKGAHPPVPFGTGGERVPGTDTTAAFIVLGECDPIAEALGRLFIKEVN